jgi:hypothetical protein
MPAGKPPISVAVSVIRNIGYGGSWLSRMQCVTKSMYLGPQPKKMIAQLFFIDILKLPAAEDIAHQRSPWQVSGWPISPH